jgi:hypothetical protein
MLATVDDMPNMPMSAREASLGTVSDVGSFGAVTEHKQAGPVAVGEAGHVLRQLDLLRWVAAVVMRPDKRP